MIIMTPDKYDDTAILAADQSLKRELVERLKIAHDCDSLGCEKFCGVRVLIARAEETLAEGWLSGLKRLP